MISLYDSHRTKVMGLELGYLGIFQTMLEALEWVDFAEKVGLLEGEVLFIDHDNDGRLQRVADLPQVEVNKRE